MAKRRNSNGDSLATIATRTKRRLADCNINMLQISSDMANARAAFNSQPDSDGVILGDDGYFDWCCANYNWSSDEADRWSHVATMFGELAGSTNLHLVNMRTVLYLARPARDRYHRVFEERRANYIAAVLAGDKQSLSDIKNWYVYYSRDYKNRRVILTIKGRATGRMHRIAYSVKPDRYPESVILSLWRAHLGAENENVTWTIEIKRQNRFRRVVR